MTTTSLQLTKHIRWSECRHLSELALLIDAAPTALRIPLLQLAITSESASELKPGNIVGEIRSLLVNCLAQVFGGFLTTKITAMEQLPDLDLVLCRFELCRDPAEIQLAVCDLVECLALTASVSI